MNRPKALSSFRTRLFADGADLQAIKALAEKPFISGFTTNPTLMRKAGVSDYEAFAKEALGIIGDRPISFEVFSDEPGEMERQARKIASWGRNIFVKIPVTNTRGESTRRLVKTLTLDGVQLNVTALLTVAQVREMREALSGGGAACISVFAGRIADTGIDPIPIMKEALAELSQEPQIGLIWASPREVLNVVQADGIGCDIITVTPEILGKLPMLGNNLDALSLETVKMFAEDAQSAGYEI